MNDPHIWWYVTRASALIGWVLLTVTVLWGILLSTRVLRKIDNPSWLQDLHRYLAGLALVMIVVHMVSLMLDGWLQFTVAETLIPFATDFKSTSIALGIIAFYLLLAVQLTAIFMNRLPRAFWKSIHYASYVVLLFVALHAGWTGTDVTTWWYRILALILIGSATIAVITRIIVGNQSRKNSAKEPTQDETENRPAPGVVKIPVVVARAETVADNVMSLRFVPLGGEPLPIWQPGAHITVYLPDGRERQYSLCGDPADRGHFDIAVLDVGLPEGVSSWIHTSVKPGMVFDVSEPRNHFELEPAKSYQFIAGGIGITPIKAMIESLPSSRKWSLLYYGKSLSTMAFAQELKANYPDNVEIITSASKKKPRLSDLLLTDSDVYCCGPERLMSEVTEIVPEDRLHVERFVAFYRESAIPAHDTEIVCSKSKKTIVAKADQSLLEALEENGIPILGSCRKGVCGTCEVRITEGTPIHLDSVIPDDEKDERGVFYPCVSRAEEDRITLKI